MRTPFDLRLRCRSCGRDFVHVVLIGETTSPMRCVPCRVLDSAAETCAAVSLCFAANDFTAEPHRAR